MVNAKVQGGAAGTASTPILCVGEGLEVRQAGDHVAHTLAQLDGALAGLTGRAGRAAWSIAYEPVWAIGTGEVATPEDAQEVCAAIRTRLAELYGGDVADGDPDPVRRLGEGGQRRRASWPSPTSTARWSAGRASTPTSSRRSAASATTCRIVLTLAPGTGR